MIKWGHDWIIILKFKDDGQTEIIVDSGCRGGCRAQKGLKNK